MAYANRAAGLENVLNVLIELAEEMRVKELLQVAEHTRETSCLQRLGFLLEKAGAKELASNLAEYLVTRKVHLVLMAGLPMRSRPVDKKWQIVVNEILEADL